MRRPVLIVPLPTAEEIEQIMASMERDGIYEDSPGFVEEATRRMMAVIEAKTMLANNGDHRG